MRFHPFNRRRAAAGRRVERPTSPGDDGPSAGSALADEVEAFLNGGLVELCAAQGSEVAPWMVLNRLAHGDLTQMQRLARGEAGAPSMNAYNRAWAMAQASLALQMLASRPDRDDIRRIQSDVLVPLELGLVSQSNREPFTLGQVVAKARDALDRHRLDH